MFFEQLQNFCVRVEKT